MRTMVKCLVPWCKKKVTARGLCIVCYDVALRLVRSKRTSWNKLEEMGKSLPALNPPRGLEKTGLSFMDDPDGWSENRAIGQ